MMWTPAYKHLVDGIVLFYRRLINENGITLHNNDLTDLDMDLVDVVNDFMEELLEEAHAKLSEKPQTGWMIRRTDTGEWMGKSYPVGAYWGKHPRIFSELRHIKESVRSDFMHPYHWKLKGKRFEGFEIEAVEVQFLPTGKTASHDELMGGGNG